ncbi:MAG: hypothetical protein AB8B65_11765 [Kordia sp.]|uniref:hypothetical protein n=1 Tax=Kordia sp. TaxID=1965332 RepID=UPI00385D0E03
MSSILFKDIQKNLVTETTKRTMDIDHTNSSVGPLVHIEKNTGVIHITAYFLDRVLDTDIYIPECVTVDEKDGKSSIKINIKNTSSLLKNEPNEDLLNRKHWELRLEPKDEDKIPLLELHEIQVEIDFNEKSGLEKPITAFKALTEIKNVVANINEEETNEKINKIKEILKKIHTVGEPRRGTKFIPPK